MNSGGWPRELGPEGWRTYNSSQHHKEHLTIAKDVGDRAGEGMAYGNLGIAYQSRGDYAKAIEYHVAKEGGDRAGEGMEYGNLGIAYGSQGGCSQAIAYLTQRLSIAKEMDTRCTIGCFGYTLVAKNWRTSLSHGEANT